MKRIFTGMAVLIVTLAYNGYAADCSCSDWVDKGGYCVNYVKQRIPSFPVPQSTTEIAVLKNKEIHDVTEGDVVMFNTSNYWHVAYVEKVHLNQQGLAATVDVSEMNFGDQLPFGEFKKAWGTRSEGEWKRALCCGVTENYGLMSSRAHIPLNTVKQIWSPDVVDSEDKKLGAVVMHKAREVINRFSVLVEKYL
jgi:hypothetical protein